MRDKDEKLFYIGKLQKKISSNLIALLLSSGYSVVSDNQNCDRGKSLCLDINVVSQKSCISKSFSTVLRLHESISSAKGLIIQKFP